MRQKPSAPSLLERIVAATEGEDLHAAFHALAVALVHAGRLIAEQEGWSDDSFKQFLANGTSDIVDNPPFGTKAVEH
jgi:hypothetical protein